MKNPVQPTTELVVPDPIKGSEATFELQVTFESISVAEDLTGRSLLVGITRRDIDRPTISLVKALLFAALLPSQPAITFEEASAFVTRKTIRLIWSKVIAAWAEGMREPDQADEDPTAAQS